MNYINEFLKIDGLFEVDYYKAVEESVNLVNKCKSLYEQTSELGFLALIYRFEWHFAKRIANKDKETSNTLYQSALENAKLYLSQKSTEDELAKNHIAHDIERLEKIIDNAHR